MPGRGGNNKNVTITCMDCGIIIMHAHITRKRCDKCAKIAQRKQSKESILRNIDNHRERGAERKRIVRALNPEKNKSIQLKWREKNREESRLRTKKWREENPIKAKETASNCYYNNLDKRKKQRDQNRESLREKSRKYDKEHPEKMRARVKRRRAKKIGASSKHTIEQFLLLCKRLNWKCSYCGIKLELENITEDHVLPLSRGGGDNIENIVPACRYCNTQKGSKTYEEYMRYLRKCKLVHSISA